jgi:NAD-dependent deacetylase
VSGLRKVKPFLWSVEGFPFREDRPFWVVLTGAGVSAESGLKTFRDADGLWEGHDVYDVASPEGWKKNPSLVREFYNQRRRQLGTVLPNAAHFAIAEMEKFVDVLVITQNVDDLHERGGSSHVLHLHGELSQVRSVADASLIYDWGYSVLDETHVCERGNFLRPNIVWFGEDVPLYSAAAAFARQADGILVVGTSLQVYPAAGLIHEVPSDARKVLIDRVIPREAVLEGFECVEQVATEGMREFLRSLN